MAGITPGNLGSDFTDALTEGGTFITITNFGASAVVYSGTDYDEEYLQDGSQTIVSGLGFFNPIGASELEYVREGKLWQGDLKLFVAGSMNIFPNSRVKINGGSEYDVLPDGLMNFQI